jgi:hypothetical protein
VEFEPQLWVGTADGWQNGRQKKRCDGRDNAKAQRTCEGLIAVTGSIVKFADCAEDLARAGQDFPTCRGYEHRLMSAREKLEFEGFFKLSNLGTQPRLRDVTGVSSRLKRSMVLDRSDVFELANCCHN